MLEVGCSVGNVARGFLRYPHIAYTGVDIDPAAIRSAQPLSEIRAHRFQANLRRRYERLRRFPASVSSSR